MLALRSALQRRVRWPHCACIARSKVIFAEKEPDISDIQQEDEVFIPWKAAITTEEDLKSAQEDEHEEEDDDKNLSEAVKKLIIHYGRVPYHHCPTLPEYVQERQRVITQHRTTPQLRRSLKTWMLPLKNYEEMQAYLKRDLTWHSEAPRKSEPGVGVWGAEEAGAYAHFFLPSAVVITTRILKELRTLLPDFRPQRVLDFGCGVGSAAVALHEAFQPQDAGDAASSSRSGSAAARQDMTYVGLDHSQAMLDANKILTQGLFQERVFVRGAAELLRLA
eukprot:gene34572-41863_t